MPIVVKESIADVIPRIEKTLQDLELCEELYSWSDNHLSTDAVLFVGCNVKRYGFVDDN